MRCSLALLPLVLIACSSSSSDSTPANTDAGSTSVADGGSGTPDSSTPTPDGGMPMGDGGVTIGDSSTADSGPATATLRVHYPAGAHRIALRGSAGPLNWTTGVALTASPNDTWTYSFGVLAASLELKPLLDDATWSRGPNYTILPGQTIDIYPHFTTIAGSYSVKWPSFTSTVLPSTRGIYAYLPPSYGENTLARFPVVYMHDGQNLFDPSTAFGGNEWKVDETLNAAAEDGSIREAIVIGIDNDADRINELTPDYDASEMSGGKGDLYIRMIIEELKPMVDMQLRTLTTRDQTAILGSSLGGLLSAYAGVKRADVFGIVGAMSPSTWWDNTMIIGQVATMPMQPSKPLLVYVDSGDSGTSNDDVTNTAALAQQFRSVGYVDNATLKYVVQPGGQHSEIYWSQRLPGALAFLLGPRTP